jgi:hypothetical protein
MSKTAPVENEHSRLASQVTNEATSSTVAKHRRHMAGYCSAVDTPPRLDTRVT